MHRKADIDRYLAEGLSIEDEQALRSHLRDCAECRNFYDEQLQLRRALAGAPTQPTRAEEARLQRLVFQRAGLSLPFAFTPAPRRAVIARFRESPWRLAVPMGAAAIALILGVWLLRPGYKPPPTLAQHDVTPDVTHAAPQQPIAAARLTHAQEATIDGAPAKPGAAIQSGSKVEVAAEGIAELELLRGGRVRLFSNSEIKLTPHGETVELEAGRIWCEVEPGRGRFIVRTQRGEARVLGTSFIVEKLAVGDIDVRVVSGLVEVEDAGHRGVVRVQNGQRTRLTASAPPLRVQHYEVQSDRDEWEQALRKLGRELERELERGLRKLGNKRRSP